MRQFCSKKKDDAWLQLAEAMNRFLSGRSEDVTPNLKPDKMKINAFS